MLPVIVRLDQGMVKLTRGRVPLLRLAGLPELFLTVKGRKSGTPRTTPLLYAPYGDDILIAGSFWGNPKLPVWVLNLRAAGDAEVEVRGKRHRVKAREVHDEERDRLWQVLNDTWPNYAHYATKTDRLIPVFHLTKTS